MDFTPQNNQAGSPVHHVSQSKKKLKKLGGLKVISVILLGAASILILALVALSVFGGPVHQSKYLDKSKLQAVFLNNGQVYFGNITNLSKDYMRLANIYYLRQSQSPQPADNKQESSDNLALVKLGCEVHGPVDEMIVNRDQVNFWENLKSDGQVAKAVEQFVQQNPEGQKCQANT
ncbi:hypothetical protein A3D14_02255 [Candidatus Saccharibacteria bacterium RIFCSPHIGHO2_02_FULL_47_12]|nr:MAG: hypothetical protein A3D14_02255 [Candidatus Saccharibacteria bacterium RIFCSPHIGHO2_02_FULL_47_12]